MNEDSIPATTKPTVIVEMNNLNRVRSNLEQRRN